MEYETDYRDQLRQHFEELKTQGSRYMSFQYAANKVGVSKSYLHHVLNKKRHVSLEKLPAVLRLLKMPRDESVVLFFMVIRAIVNDRQLKSYCECVLKALKSGEFTITDSRDHGAPE